MSAQRAADEHRPSLPRCCAEAVAAATAPLRAQLSEARAEAAALREQLQRIRGNLLAAPDLAPSTPSPTPSANPGSVRSLHLAEARQPERPPLRFLELPAPGETLAPLSLSLAEPLLALAADALMFVISASLVDQFTQTQREASEALSWALSQFQPLSPLDATLPVIISSSFAHLFSWPTQIEAVDESQLSLYLLPTPLSAFSATLPFLISSSFAHLFTWPTQSAAVDAARPSLQQEPLLLLAAPDLAAAFPATIDLPVIVSSGFAHLFTWPVLQAPPEALSWSRRLQPSPLNAFSSILPFYVSSSYADLFSWPTLLEPAAVPSVAPEQPEEQSSSSPQQSMSQSLSPHGAPASSQDDTDSEISLVERLRLHLLETEARTAQDAVALETQADAAPPPAPAAPEPPWEGLASRIFGAVASGVTGAAASAAAAACKAAAAAASAAAAAAASAAAAEEARERDLHGGDPPLVTCLWRVKDSYGATEDMRGLVTELQNLKAWSAWELARWARLYPSVAAILAQADAARPAGTRDWKDSLARAAAALGIVGFELQSDLDLDIRERVANGGKAAAAKKHGPRRSRQDARFVAFPVGAPATCPEWHKVDGHSLEHLLENITGASAGSARDASPLARYLTCDYAVLSDSTQKAVAMLLHRLDVLGVPNDGVWRAAHAAAAKGCTMLLDKLMSIAMKQHAEKALLSVRDNGSAGRGPATLLSTALHARSITAMLWLCDAGRACGVAVAAEAEKAADDSVLHSALTCSDKSAAEIGKLCAALLANGAAAMRLNSSGDTAVHVAFRQGCMPAVRAILGHDAAVARKLLVAVDKQGRSLLHCAAAKGSAPVVDTIIKCVSGDLFGSLQLARDELGRTPLHLALVAAGARAYAVEAEAAVAAAERQLERERARHGDLSAAAERLRSLRRLAEKYAAECAATTAGAVADAEEVVSKLLSAPGFDGALQAQDHAGRCPLHVSSLASQPPASAVLSSALKRLPSNTFRAAVIGCALHSVARVMDNAAQVCSALAAGALADARNEDGRLALHMAWGRDTAVALLAAYPAGLNAPDKFGFTPLIVRAASDDPGSVEALLAAPGVLVEGGAARANDGRSPLDVATPLTAPLLRAHIAAAKARADATQAALAERRVATMSTPALTATALLDERSVTGKASSAANADAAAEAAWAREAERVRADLLPEMGALRAAVAAAAADHRATNVLPAPKPLAAQSSDDVEIDDVSLAQLEGRPWELQCTAEVRDAIAAQQPDLRKRTLRCLRDLADGEWQAAVFLSSESGELLYKIRITHHSASGLRLLFQQAVDYSPRAGGYVECVRIWALVKHDAFDRALAATQASLRLGGRAAVRVHLRLSTAPPRRGERVMPRAFARVDESAAAGVVVHTPPVDLSCPAEPLLRVFIDVSNELAAALLRSASAAAACDWPAHVDEAEARLVYKPFDEPMLLLGRSGTGKTTVAVHRMWRLYRHAGVSRFVFVTANAALRDRVCELFRRMQRGAGGASARAAEAADALDAKGGPRSLASTPGMAWPLFVTTAKWLCLLDGASDKPYFPRTSDGALLQPELAPAAWRPGGARDAASATDAGQPDVDFRIFKRRFWEGMLSALAGSSRGAAGDIPRGAAAAVWREIVSFIKAGAHGDDLSRVGTPLTRDEYVALRTKIAPAFSSPEQRNAVYDMYERYQEMKKAKGVYDAADIVCHIARAQNKRPLGAGPHALAHVFIDEVQDLTQAELLLLVKSLQRPGGGLFLAGDTAQAITDGVGFRFEDTKALLFRMAAEGATARAPPRWGKPALHWLTVNYRAQTGLVDCAAAVSELLVKLFPGAVDALPRERGFFRGRRPILERATEVGDIMATFLSPGPGGDDFGVFGARQAVLVRSAAARQRLALEQPWLTNMGATILTVEESKGLEFDDVFLFDFFRDSECGSEWVVVADAAVKRWGFIPENMRGTDASMDAAIARYRRCQRHCAELNPRIHGRLLRELQLLYVALSRGRRRLFIFDTDADKRAPMFTFLASPVAVPDTDTAGPPVALFSHEAHTEQLDDYDVIDATTAPGAQTAAAAGAATARPAAVLLSASSASEWQTQGAALLANGVFAAAAEAFFKAGNHDGGWRATGAELLRRADEAAAAAPARARALRLRAVRAYAAGHAAADALAAARLAGDAQLLAALEGRSQA